MHHSTKIVNDKDIGIDVCYSTLINNEYVVFGNWSINKWSNQIKSINQNNVVQLFGPLDPTLPTPCRGNFFETCLFTNGVLEENLAILFC